MKYNITFVPTNSSHVPKNSSLLSLLRQRGHRIRILCLDPWFSHLHAALPSIRKTDFDWEEIAPINIPREARTILRACYSRRIARAVKARIEANPSTDLFIFGGDRGVISRTFIRTARKSGVPSVLVLDGLILPDNPDYVPLDGILKRLRDTLGYWAYKLLFRQGPKGASGVELVLAINETGRQALIANGAPKDIIEVVGSPEYDAIAAEMDDTGDVSQAAIREKLRIAADRPVVFYAHQTFGIPEDGYRQIIKKLAEGCVKANAILLVKFHPRGQDAVSQWRQWAASVGLSERDVVFARDECTSIEAVQLCSICVTVFSTVALEALINSRPLMILRYLNAQSLLPYAQQYGVALEVFDEQELSDSIARLVQDPDLRSRLLANRSAAIAHELAGLDGKSGERSALAIERLLAKRAE